MLTFDEKNGTEFAEGIKNHLAIKSELQPRYTSPDKRSFIEYYDSIKQFNRSLQKNVSLYLCKLMGEPQHFSFATTGSDGRYEKGPGSEMELVVLLKQETDIKEILDALLKIIKEKTEKDVFDDIEIRNLDKDILSFYNGDKKRIFPSRTTDLAYLCGNNSFIGEAKLKLISEFSGAEGKIINEEIKNKKREYRSIMRDGKQSFKGSNFVHYDFEKAEVNFNPENGLWSFKYGPLRAVQFSIIKDLVYSVKNKKDTNFINSMPNNTEERIYFFEAERMLNLSQTETSDLVNSYKFFLWFYHLSQWEHRNNEKTRIDASPFKNEIKERIESLDKILSKSLIK